MRLLTLNRAHLFVWPTNHPWYVFIAIKSVFESGIHSCELNAVFQLVIWSNWCFLDRLCHTAAVADWFLLQKIVRVVVWYQHGQLSSTVFVYAVLFHPGRLKIRNEWRNDAKVHCIVQPFEYTYLRFHHWDQEKSHKFTKPLGRIRRLNVRLRKETI